MTRVPDTDIFYSTFFFDIAFSDEEIMNGVNYDSDYEESLLLSAPYLEKQAENGVDGGKYIRSYYLCINININILANVWYRNIYYLLSIDRGMR